MKDSPTMADKAMLHDLEVDAHLADSVQIVPEQLQEEFVRLPGDLAYFVEKSAESKRAELLAKRELERTRAHLHLTVREGLKEEGVKATVGDIDAHIKLHPEFQQAQEAAIMTEADFIAARGRVDALKAKKDMLIALGTMWRAERFGNPEVRDKEAEPYLDGRKVP